MSENLKIFVYIVDDNKSVRRALELLLLSADINVSTYETAEEFLLDNPRQNNSCIITDIMMREIDGFKLKEKLDEIGCKIPVIFLTGVDTPESRSKAKQIGVASYLKKPVDDQALLDSIHWVLSGST